MKWIHNLLKGVSALGALFVFQACYGTPQPPQEYLESVEATETVATEEAPVSDSEAVAELPEEAAE